MNLFEEFNDRFNMLVNVCWTSIFKVKLLFDHPIFNAVLFVNATNKKLFLSNLMIGFYCIIVIVLEVLILK